MIVAILKLALNATLVLLVVLICFQARTQSLF